MDYDDYDILNSRKNIEINKDPGPPKGLISKTIPRLRDYIHAQIRFLLEPVINQQREFNEAVVAEIKALKLLKKLDFDYLSFENKFRGSPEEITRRNGERYLKYFKGSSNVLDIGCGRGEFIKLLADNGVTANGVEINHDMALLCQSYGFDVKEADALEYLKRLEDDSVGGVFMCQLVEHLEPAYIIDLLRQCHKKMLHDSFIAIETVNVTSLFALVNPFYIDFTHRQPLHPETLKFLLEYVGFRDLKTEFYSPPPDKMKLKKIPTSGMSKSERGKFDIINENIDKTNNFLYGDQDCAVIGKK